MVQNLRSRRSQAVAYSGLGVYTRINSSFRVLCTPRPEEAAAYFLSYKRPWFVLLYDVYNDPGAMKSSVWTRKHDEYKAEVHFYREDINKLAEQLPDSLLTR